MSYTDFVRATNAINGDVIKCMGVKVSDMNLLGNETGFITANAVRQIPTAIAARKLVPPNTVVFPKRGAAIATNKKRMTTTWTALDPNLIGLRPKDGLDEQFLYYWSQTLDLRKITDPGPTPQLNKKDLLPVQISFPTSIAEQRQIARVLSAVQRAVERQERLIALTAELKNALMNKLFTGGTRGERLKPTELGLVPESWALVEISTLGKCVTGTTPSTKVTEFYTPEEFCFVSPADLGKSKYANETAKMISEDGLRVARELPRDSVLCVCIGSSIGKTGMTHHLRSCTNQQINAVVVAASNNPHFVYYLLTFWSEHWRGHATFGPVPILSKGAFEKVQVPFTSDRDEQDCIADVLSAADEKVEHHIKHRDSIAALFRTLLHQLMTAQVHVRDLDLSALNELAVENCGGHVNGKQTR